MNEPGHHGGAYLLLSVPDTEGARGSYVQCGVRFEIADCARKVQLEFPWHDATGRRNGLKKARLLSRAFFVVRLLRRLQKMASPPAIEYDEYARALGPSTE